MKIKWLATDVTAVKSTDRAERAVFGGAFGRFLVGSGGFCGPGATLWCENPLLSPHNFT